MPEQRNYAVYFHPQAIDGMGEAIKPYLTESAEGKHVLCHEIDTSGPFCEMTLVKADEKGKPVECEVMRTCTWAPARSRTWSTNVMSPRKNSRSAWSHSWQSMNTRSACGRPAVAVSAAAALESAAAWVESVPVPRAVISVATRRMALTRGWAPGSWRHGVGAVRGRSARTTASTVSSSRYCFAHRACARSSLR